MFAVPNGYPFTPSVSTITSTGLNYLYSNLPNALDIVNGGSYTATTKATIGGAVGLRCNFTAVGLEVAGAGGMHIINGSHLTFDDVSELKGTVTNQARIKWRTNVVADADSNLSVSYDVYRLAVPTANRIHTLLNTTAPIPKNGERLIVVRPNSGAFTYTIQQEGLPDPLATLAAGTACTAEFVWFSDVNGGSGAWWLACYSSGVTPGAGATFA